MITKIEEIVQEFQMVDKASYTTSYALVELHKQLIKTDFLTYCDTDSIHGMFNLENHDMGSELGQWKEEYYNIIQAVYLLPKVYWIYYEDKDGVYRTKCTAKGFPSRLFCYRDSRKQRLIPLVEFLEIVKEGYEFEIFMSLKQAIKHTGKILNYHEFKRVINKTESDKRKFNFDGTSEPLEVFPDNEFIEDFNKLCDAIDLEIAEVRKQEGLNPTITEVKL